MTSERSENRPKLSELYAIFAEESAGLDLACRPGCATCCTRSVTLTTAEGRLIIDYLRERGEGVPDLPSDPAPLRPNQTTNGLAGLCLDGSEAEPEADSPWSFAPCFFLRDGLCAIYPVRPFACRSFTSTNPCAQSGVAEAPEWAMTLAVVTNQILEDLDRGGWWGNLADVLAFLDDRIDGTGNPEALNRLLPTRPLPGFLVMPEERPLVARLLAKVTERVGSKYDAPW